MNLFRSEEHVSAWIAEHPGLSREVLSFEQACAWMRFLGAERLREDYVHPRAKGTLGPFLMSLGLTGEFWRPPGSA
jgi:hypothetical protein